MTHELSVSFKVFLLNGEISEVRRFGVDRDVVSNFGYLKEKLQTVFPTLRGTNFSVSWKDSDGDNIVISSDDELIIALTEMQADVRKLFVTVEQGTPMQQDGEGQQVHVGVTCDGCQKGVEGFRYKCIQCPDYDLCVSCESKGLHGEHYMIRMPVPTLWRPHFGKRLAHHLAKATLRSGVHSGWDSDESHHWKHHGKFHGDKHHGDKHRGDKHDKHHDDRHHFGWLETLAAYLNEWSNLPGEDGAPGKDDSAGCSSSTQQKSQEQQEDARVQYLRNIGQTVASVLDPLGIDVDIEVRTKDKNEKDSKPEEEQKKTDNKEDEVSQMDVDDKQDNNNASNNAAPSKSQRESPESEGWTVVSGDIPQQGAAAQVSSATAAATASVETGALPKQPETSSAPPTTSTQSSAPVTSANVYPTLFNLPSHQATPTAFPMHMPHMQPPHMPPPHMGPPHMGPPHLAHPFMNHQPNMFAPREPNMKPHIADALDKMMSMGFSNDGGWLTQLLESKNGDIEKALDVLQPVAVKKSN